MIKWRNLIYMISYFLLFSYVFKKYMTVLSIFVMDMNFIYIEWIGNDRWGRYCHIDPGRQRSLTWSTSPSLVDNLGLANVLASCFHFSETRVNPNSLFLTESSLCSRKAQKSLASTVLQCVEESLCAPQSMISTLYGLRLANHVELGTLNNRNNPTRIPQIKFTWQQTLLLENVPLGSSASLVHILKKLENKCMEDQREPPKRKSVALNVTPLVNTSTM